MRRDRLQNPHCSNAKIFRFPCEELHVCRLARTLAEAVRTDHSHRGLKQLKGCQACLRNWYICHISHCKIKESLFKGMRQLIIQHLNVIEIIVTAEKVDRNIYTLCVMRSWVSMLQEVEKALLYLFPHIFAMFV